MFCCFGVVNEWIIKVEIKNYFKWRLAELKFLLDRQVALHSGLSGRLHCVCRLCECSAIPAEVWLLFETINRKAYVWRFDVAFFPQRHLCGKQKICDKHNGSFKTAVSQCYNVEKCLCDFGTFHRRNENALAESMNFSMCSKNRTTFLASCCLVITLS